MEICFLPLCMRRERLANEARPFQVDRNDEGIAIASSSFFLNARPSWVVGFGRHGRTCYRLLYHACGDFIQVCKPGAGC
jgi:hypothetical protein